MEWSKRMNKRSCIERQNKNVKDTPHFPPTAAVCGPRVAWVETASRRCEEPGPGCGAWHCSRCLALTLITSPSSKILSSESCIMLQTSRRSSLADSNSGKSRGDDKNLAVLWLSWQNYFVRIMFRSLSFPYPEKYNFNDPQFVVTRHTGTLPAAHKNLMNSQKIFNNTPQIFCRRGRT